MLARRLLPVGTSGGFTVPTTLYGLYNGQDGVSANYRVFAATSTDHGASWTKHGIVLSPGAATTWDDDHVKDPWLVWDGAQYVMYYAGYDGADYRIGRATASSHSGTWTKYGSNPVIGFGAGGTFDDAGALFPTVLHEPSDTAKPWKMWYGADDGAVLTIGYAHSADGLTFTKVGQVLTVGSSGAFDDEGVIPASVVKVGTTYHLFYGGRQGAVISRWQTGLATFTDPEGTYTKQGIVAYARFNDSGTSQTLTANTLIGSAVVTVASTSAYNVGEAVVVADGNSETHTSEIVTIGSGTQVTLADAVLSDFTTAQGAVLRPLAWNSLFARAVRGTAGGYEMYATAFQPVDDLVVGGTTLREGSVRLTSATIGGTYAYDYSAGLLLPLFPANTGADKFSSENMSVILAP